MYKFWCWYWWLLELKRFDGLLNVWSVDALISWCWKLRCGLSSVTHHARIHFKIPKNWSMEKRSAVRRKVVEKRREEILSYDFIDLGWLGPVYTPIYILFPKPSLCHFIHLFFMITPAHIFHHTRTLVYTFYKRVKNRKTHVTWPREFFACLLPTQKERYSWFSLPYCRRLTISSHYHYLLFISITNLHLYKISTNPLWKQCWFK